MKLLSKEEQVKKKVAVEKDKEKLERAFELERVKFNNFRDEVGKDKERIQSEHAEFIHGILKERKDKFTEVQELERRKLEALKPIQDKTKELMSREEEVSEREKRAKTKETNLITREWAVANNIKSYTDREQTLRNKAEEIEKASNKLNEERDDFRRFTERHEKRLKEQLKQAREFLENNKHKLKHGR